MPVYKTAQSKHWLIEFTVDGRRYRRSSGTTVKRKAQQLEAKWREEVHAGTFKLAKPTPMTMEEATTRYYDTVVTLSPSRDHTKKAEWYALGVITARFGSDTQLTTLTAADITKWRDAMLGEGRAPGTVNRYLATLRAILNRASLEWGALPEPPHIKLLRLSNGRQRYLSYEEEERLLDVAKPHLRRLVIFLLDTGARLSEAIELEWSAVRLDGDQGGSVVFERTKNTIPRQVPLTNRVAKMLATMKEESGAKDPHVFLYIAPGELRGIPFKYPLSAWRTALRKAGIDEPIRLHDLRHTFASRLVSKGVPLLDVSQLLGHKSLSMTMRYAHLAPSAYQVAIAKLEQAEPEETTSSN